MADEKTGPATFGELDETTVEVTSDEDADSDAGESDSDEDDGAEEAESDSGDESGDDEDSDEVSEGDEEDLSDEESDSRRGKKGDEEDEDDEEEETDADEEFEDMSKKDKNKEIHEVKVDGKLEKVSLAELKESYASKTSNARAYTKFQEERKQWQAETKKVNDLLAPAWNALKADKLEECFLELAKVKGKSTLEIKRQLRRELAPSIVQYLKMDEPSRRQFDLAEENEYYKSLVEAKKRESSESEALSRAESQILTLQAKHGISDEEMENAVGWLEKNTFKANPAAIKPDNVLEAVLVSRAISRAFEAVRVERPSLEKNEKFMDRVIRYARANPTLSISGLTKYVKEKALSIAPKGKDANELARDISRKVLKTKPKSSFESPKKSKKPQAFNELI